MSELHRRFMTGIGLSLFSIGLFFLPLWVFTLIILGILVRIVGWEWTQLFSSDDKWFWIILPWYPLLPAFLILYMQLYGYDMLNLLTIGLVGAHDTGAYVIGKHFGQHPISPISPNKTWEGFMAGFLLSLLLAVLLFWHNPFMIMLGSIVPLVLSINFAALAGDLFESFLKRHAGLKDAGQLLPGHGGILDRIDGLLSATCIVFLGRAWIMKLLL